MKEILVGVISDTHGLLRPEAIQALRGCNSIIHAGDVDKPGILESLEQIAPVTAVRGNCDSGSWTTRLHKTETIQIGEVFLHVIHNLDQLDLDPKEADIRVVISGHTHRPLIEERQGVLFLNPGAAGPKRFDLSPSLVLLRIAGKAVKAELIELED
jgi:uncharacterized protein